MWSNWKEKEKNLVEKYKPLIILYEDDLKDRAQWQQTANRVFDYLDLLYAHYENLWNAIDNEA